MIIKIEKIKDYNYIAITFKNPEDKKILDEVIKNAENVSKKVSPFDPGRKLRTDRLKLRKNLGGLLAEKAVEIYIDSLIKQNSLKTKIIDSEIQEDTKVSWNQIDMNISVNEIIKTIEIRSSFSYKTRFSRLFGVPLYNGRGAFSIIGWYTHEHKIKEVKKDYYIFCVHFYDPINIDEYLKNEITVYIAGGASKKTLENEGYDSNLNQKGAKYRIINPLISVPDPFKVINEILEL